MYFTVSRSTSLSSLATGSTAPVSVMKLMQHLLPQVAVCKVLCTKVFFLLKNGTG